VRMTASRMCSSRSVNSLAVLLPIPPARKSCTNF
jgi:hypothetical protein